jgi:hypothetical protein
MRKRRMGQMGRRESTRAMNKADFIGVGDDGVIIHGNETSQENEDD